MPSTMVHLITAYKINPDSPPEFWVGNLAPDFIENWVEKDCFHLRDKADRGIALNELAKSIDKDDPFSEGILLHLFVDWKWDDDLRQKYISGFKSGGWFQSYRNEIGLLSARLYHDSSWSESVWEEIMNFDFAKVGEIGGVSFQNGGKILSRANRFHLDNPSAKPLFYTAEMIAKFTSKTAQDYQYWRKEITS